MLKRSLKFNLTIRQKICILVNSIDLCLLKIFTENFKLPLESDWLFSDNQIQALLVSFKEHEIEILSGIIRKNPNL